MARSRIALEGLPHSEIFGSKPVCGSPKLIAAYHVLHRRPAPRHPPYALSSLTTTSALLESVVVFFLSKGSSACFCSCTLHLSPRLRAGHLVARLTARSMPYYALKRIFGCQ